MIGGMCEVSHLVHLSTSPSLQVLAQGHFKCELCKYLWKSGVRPWGLQFCPPRIVPGSLHLEARVVSEFK